MPRRPRFCSPRRRRPPSHSNIQGTGHFVWRAGHAAGTKAVPSAASPCAGKAAHCMKSLVTHDMWALPKVLPLSCRRNGSVSVQSCFRWRQSRLSVSASQFRSGSYRPTGVVVRCVHLCARCSEDVCFPAEVGVCRVTGAPSLVDEEIISRCRGTTRESSFSRSCGPRA